jgi:hypothetical protein
MPARSPRNCPNASSATAARTRPTAGHSRASERVGDAKSVDFKSTLFPHLAAPISFLQCDLRENSFAPSLQALHSVPQSAVRRGSPNTKPIRRHTMSRFLPSSVFVHVSSVTVPQAVRERCSDER